MLLPYLSTELWLNIGQCLADNDLLSLCLTSRQKHNDLINDLVDRGVTASKSWTSCCTTAWLGCPCLEKHPALWAIKNNQLSLLSRLFDRGFEANVRLEKEDQTLMFWGGNSQSEPWSLLTFAIYYNRVDFVRLLLDKGADVNHQTKPNESRQLLDKGADVNRQTEPKKSRLISPLNFAVWNEFSNHANSEIVGLLLEHDADVDYEGEKNQEIRPLHLALEKGTYNSHFEIVKLLVQNGAAVRYYPRVPRYIGPYTGWTFALGDLDTLIRAALMWDNYLEVVEYLNRNSKSHWDSWRRDWLTNTGVFGVDGGVSDELTSWVNRQFTSSL